MENTRTQDFPHDDCVAMVCGAFDHTDSIRKSRSCDMDKCPRNELQREMSRHAGEAYSGVSAFFARGGPDYVPGTDDASEVSQVFLSRTEIWLDRLDAVIVGAERSGDFNREFRSRYAALSEE